MRGFELARQLFEHGSLELLPLCILQLLPPLLFLCCTLAAPLGLPFQLEHCLQYM